MFYLEHIGIERKAGVLYPVLKDKMGKKLGAVNGFRKILGRFFNYILDFELLIVRIAGFVPFHTFRSVVYRGVGVRMGRGAHIHMGAQFFYPAGVEIGEDTLVGQNVFLDGRGVLKIGNHVDIASEVMIYNSEHDVNSSDFAAVTSPVEIADYCFVGPRVIILPGVKIGKGAVVGAGAVVTHDVEEFSIVGGVPARVIGRRKVRDLKYRLGRARLFQ